MTMIEEVRELLARHGIFHHLLVTADDSGFMIHCTNIPTDAVRQIGCDLIVSAADQAQKEGTYELENISAEGIQ